VIQEREANLRRTPDVDELPNTLQKGAIFSREGREEAGDKLGCNFRAAPAGES